MGRRDPPHPPPRGNFNSGFNNTFGSFPPDPHFTYIPGSGPQPPPYVPPPPHQQHPPFYPPPPLLYPHSQLYSAPPPYAPPHPSPPHGHPSHQTVTPYFSAPRGGVNRLPRPQQIHRLQSFPSSAAAAGGGANASSSSGGAAKGREPIGGNARGSGDRAKGDGSIGGKGSEGGEVKEGEASISSTAGGGSKVISSNSGGGKGGVGGGKRGEGGGGQRGGAAAPLGAAAERAAATAAAAVIAAAQAKVVKNVSSKVSSRQNVNNVGNGSNKRKAQDDALATAETSSTTSSITTSSSISKKAAKRQRAAERQRLAKKLAQANDPLHSPPPAPAPQFFPQGPHAVRVIEGGGDSDLSDAVIVKEREQKVKEHLAILREDLKEGVGGIMNYIVGEPVRSRWGQPLICLLEPLLVGGPERHRKAGEDMNAHANSAGAAASSMKRGSEEQRRQQGGAAAEGGGGIGRAVAVPQPYTPETGPLKQSGTTTAAANSRVGWTDAQAILCPFDLHGTCNDTECPYQHLAIKKPSSTPASTPPPTVQKPSPSSTTTITSPASSSITASTTITTTNTIVNNNKVIPVTKKRPITSSSSPITTSTTTARPSLSTPSTITRNTPLPGSWKPMETLPPYTLPLITGKPIAAHPPASKASTGAGGSASGIGGSSNAAVAVTATTVNGEAGVGAGASSSRMEEDQSSDGDDSRGAWTDYLPLEEALTEEQGKGNGSGLEEGEVVDRYFVGITPTQPALTLEELEAGVKNAPLDPEAWLALAARQLLNHSSSAVARRNSKGGENDGANDGKKTDSSRLHHHQASGLSDVESLVIWLGRLGEGPVPHLPASEELRPALRVLARALDSLPYRQAPWLLYLRLYTAMPTPGAARSLFGPPVGTPAVTAKSGASIQTKASTFFDTASVHLPISLPIWSATEAYHRLVVYSTSSSSVDLIKLLQFYNEAFDSLLNPSALRLNAMRREPPGPGPSIVLLLLRRAQCLLHAGYPALAAYTISMPLGQEVHHLLHMAKKKTNLPEILVGLPWHVALASHPASTSLLWAAHLHLTAFGELPPALLLLAGESMEKDIRVDDADGIAWSLAWSWPDLSHLVAQGRSSQIRLAKAFGAYRRWEATSSTASVDCPKGVRAVMQWNYTLVHHLLGPGEVVGPCYVPQSSYTPYGMHTLTSGLGPLDCHRLPGWVFALGRLMMIGSVMEVMKRDGPWSSFTSSSGGSDEDMETAAAQTLGNVVGPRWVEMLWRLVIENEVFPKGLDEGLMDSIKDGVAFICLREWFKPKYGEDGLSRASDTLLAICRKDQGWNLPIHSNILRFTGRRLKEEVVALAERFASARPGRAIAAVIHAQACLRCQDAQAASNVLRFALHKKRAKWVDPFERAALWLELASLVDPSQLGAVLVSGVKDLTTVDLEPPPPPPPFPSRTDRGMYNGRGFEASILWAMDQRPRRLESGALAAEALVAGALGLSRWPGLRTVLNPLSSLSEAKAAEALVARPDVPNSIALIITRALLAGALGRPSQAGILLRLRAWLKARFNLVEARWLAHDRGVGIFSSCGPHPLIEIQNTSSCWLGPIYAMVELALQDRSRAQHILERAIALDPLSCCAWLMMVQFECTFGKGQRFASVIKAMVAQKVTIPLVLPGDAAITFRGSVDYLVSKENMAKRPAGVMPLSEGKTDEFSLSWSNSLSLPTVPRSLLHLKQVLRLTLSRNGLITSSFPRSMAIHLPHLQTLTLSQNCLVRIPAVVLEMKELRYLAVDRNEITQLPTKWGHLSNSLMKLVLYGNPVIDALMEGMEEEGRTTNDRIFDLSQVQQGRKGSSGNRELDALLVNLESQLKRLVYCNYVGVSNEASEGVGGG